MKKEFDTTDYLIISSKDNQHILFNFKAKKIYIASQHLDAVLKITSILAGNDKTFTATVMNLETNKEKEIEFYDLQVLYKFSIKNGMHNLEKLFEPLHNEAYASWNELEKKHMEKKNVN